MHAGTADSLLHSASRSGLFEWAHHESARVPQTAHACRGTRHTMAMGDVCVGTRCLSGTFGMYSFAASRARLFFSDDSVVGVKV